MCAYCILTAGRQCLADTLLLVTEHALDPVFQAIYYTCTCIHNAQ